MNLEEFDRFPLAHLPTPMHKLERLSQHLNGPEIWIKRDDCTGLATGGNKTRKLEYFIADAVARNADTIVTVGGIQSNHTRQTAAAAALAGMRCELVQRRWAQWRDPHYEAVGNILLSRILGARITIVQGSGRIGVSDPELLEVVERISRAGGRPYVIPAGGSDHPLGGLGYVRCASEIVDQSVRAQVTFDAVLHATSSGSTQAGLVVGLRKAGLSTRVIGIEVNAMPKRTTVLVHKIASETARTLKIQSDGEQIDIRTGYAGEAYGQPTTGAIEAIKMLARFEGILADPVYEGKALAGMIDLIRRGELQKQQRILFIHLGGSPALHAYSSLFSPGSTP
jgi:1-aminocyclopropane-1-carboxylate deaminase